MAVALSFFFHHSLPHCAVSCQPYVSAVTSLATPPTTQCAAPYCPAAPTLAELSTSPMTCQCCTCGHCVHPAAFKPFHRPPSPPLSANTLILPSTASAIDAPLHITGRKRAHYDRDNNRTSPALLEALYWRKEEGDRDGKEEKREREDGHKSDGKEKEEKGNRPSTAQRPTDAQRTATPSIRIGTASSCRCPCHTELAALTQPSADTRPRSAVISLRLSHAVQPPQPRSTLATPPSPSAAHTKRQKADTTADTVTAIPRGTAARPPSSRPTSGRSTRGRQLHVQTPLSTDTAIFRGATAPSPIPTQHTPRTPHDGKYDDDTLDDEDEHQVNEEIEAARSEARARSVQQRAKEEAIAAADAVRRGKLQLAFQAAQAKRAQQVRADDAYYADMLQRQYERRVKMDFFQRKFELHRRERRLADGNQDERRATGGGLSRPAFVDFGGRNTRPTVEGERLLSFNITPDLPPNAPAQPQSYNSARRAATERLRQKQLVVRRVREQLEEEGAEEAGDGQSEYDKKVASLAQRQRVQQQQQHHAQRMAAATHKPQRSSRPSPGGHSAATGGGSGSAYVPLLPLPVEPMASASQSSYASFRPPSSQSVKVQRQRG